MPFLTYRRFVHGEDDAIFDLAPSLSHHYESEKFRGTSEELRLSILECSTVRAALKIAKNNQALWRKDWRAVRSRVFRAGLAMQVVQWKAALAMARAGFEKSMELAAVKRVGNLPGSFIAAELQTFFQSGAGITRLGVIALAGCVPDDIEDRLAAVFIKEKPVSAAIYAGRDADVRIEVWCANMGIPVRLTSASSMRLRELDAVEVTTRVNTLLTCMPKTRKAPQAILARANSRRPKIRVLDLTAKAKVLANQQYA